MTIEQAQKLEAQLAHEGIVMLALFQTEADVSHHEKTIPLIGKAWGIPEEVTQRYQDDLSQQIEYAKTGTQDTVHPANRILAESSGPKVMETIWHLFETAVKLDSEAERQELLEMAVDYALCQNLESKISE